MQSEAPFPLTPEPLPQGCKSWYMTHAGALNGHYLFSG